jgi:hypothetical protein
MKTSKLNSRLLSLLATSVCGVLQAGSPSIGLAMANGRFVLDHSAVVGNANIFDGSLIETENVMSDISLENGIKMRLGTEARGRVFQDRLVLEKGAGQVSGSRYLVEAGRLRIVPLNSNATARVAWGEKNLVEVAVLAGKVRVETAVGIPVANMEGGMALSFAEQAGAFAPTKLCGNVERKDGVPVLTDRTTKVSVELKGAGLDEYVGKSIAVTGNLAGPDILQVLTTKRDACGGAAGTKAAAAAGVGAGAGAGAAAAAGAAAGAAGAAGLSTVAIAGIAVGSAAGLGAGLAAATGVFSQKSASH